jgi:hypothetical protein
VGVEIDMKRKDFSAELKLQDVFDGPGGGSVTGTFSTQAVERVFGHRDDGTSIWLDRSSGGAMSCCFIQLHSRGSGTVRLALAGEYGLETCVAGGWLLLEAQGDGYWIPVHPTLRKTDDDLHILAEDSAPLYGITVSGSSVSAEFAIPTGWHLDFVVMRISQSAPEAIAELRESTTVEQASYFLWGSHTVYSRAGDVYLHTIHGRIYENRSSWPKFWKICSENDAHALFVTLSGLERATGKTVYRMLKGQLLLSVISGQGKDGGWRHGEWTDRMEAHFRLHCSGMHMLMDALAERDDPSIRHALERAAAFLSRCSDPLNCGMWFLHDELERSAEALREGPFRWVASRAFGKSESNMLVLNSHLDATIALDRYRQVTGDVQYADLVDRAKAATRAVLSQRPIEWLYALLFRWIRLTLLPTQIARGLPLHKRVLKRIAWKYAIPTLPYLKARFPRLVMPGGYVERELSARFFAHDYLPINLMDLLRFKRRFPAEPVDEIVRDGFELVQGCRMTERWTEIDGKEYALAFWAEALYHACLLYPDSRYRLWLAEAALALKYRKMGWPPSLLGANGEAVEPRHQVPTPLLDNAKIRVLNLSREGRVELLLVNCSEQPVEARFVRNAPQGLAWSFGIDETRRVDPALTIGGRGFLWGRTPDRRAP